MMRMFPAGEAWEDEGGGEAVIEGGEECLEGHPGEDFKAESHLEAIAEPPRSNGSPHLLETKGLALGMAAEEDTGHPPSL